ncbi:nucleoside triphosphate pyrophosphohydrolase ham1 [Elasticomyces elasticus]|nr:nucleoside triphosphate pyrophosphohydrolase ham1 [Elasticomyces elasticus]
MAPKELNFITGNKHKLAEVQAILSSTGVRLESRAVDLPEIQGSIEEISRDKCKRAAEAVGGPVLVEDTCLCFNAWDELPGPYVTQTSARTADEARKHFLTSLGVQKFHNLLAGFEDKSAQAVCTFAYAEGPGKDAVIFQGRTEVCNAQVSPLFDGHELTCSAGQDSRIEGAYRLRSVGWDSCFEPTEGKGQTYAEMPKNEKNAISHRGKALAKLTEWLKAET